MSNKSAPTQRQKQERARRIAMGVAKVQSPLKLIKRKAPAFVYDSAYAAAKAGYGKYVQSVALECLK